MAFRPAPRRLLKLDTYYREQGGIQAYIFAQLNAGIRVPDLAVELGNSIGEPVSATSVYDWIREWRAENAQAEEVVAR